MWSQKNGREAEGSLVGDTGELRRITGRLIGLVLSRGDYSFTVIPKGRQLRIDVNLDPCGV